MKPETRRVMFSSATGHWRTPQEVFDALNEEFHFTLDVCADRGHPLGDLRGYVGDAGLRKDWTGWSCYMNPPYGREIEKWVAKADLEARDHGVITVGLLPARTDTAWFWDHCLLPSYELRAIRGRLMFEPQTNSAPFPSMIVIFR